ncbi:MULTISPECIES: signal peptidase I [Streptococcus]|uniref:signal peptidase I n=1 Tax=Streptococcus TaxID=1301 RepID=UPI0002BA354C|nr:signal peptidase I [Streptococcus parauberis]EMF48469.1 Signal peptidase I [Streptococcus parauberis KRS-02109]KYP17931.1 Signal peptidase IB [Streptococcus parauberis]KYP19200.1 Signal peptidase IB [Streptococcus parauberis]KYP19589.1 Signal peptidase IB [Streptococcus parauberis]KYP23437.1 Signal peptidase IB [Streptococcus parauberis]
MKNFIKEWGLFTLFMLVFGFSRIFIWQPVKVDGHSMDPTLSHGERLIVFNQAKIDRFDIVVAQETEDGVQKEIVKRVIGMPGDKIEYKNDTLYVNGKKTKESYLKKFIALFKKDRLQKTYSYNSLFQELARNSSAFTADSENRATFSIDVPKGQYLLLGDDRIVSKDSREVGTFKAKNLIGEVKFRFWPFNRIDLLK